MPRSHGALRGLRDVAQSPLYEGRFGRMFRRLRTFKLTDAQVEALAAEMLTVAGTSEDNPRIPAGYTYLGQFVDHDLTFDPASSLERLNDPDALVNFRTPRFDLDSLYGRGPADEPYLYDDDAFGMFLLGKGRDPDAGANTDEDDLQRNGQGTALIGDPRNDENIIVSQLHLAFLKFHNAVLTDVREEGLAGAEAFREAQERVRWHYQWVVVHDYVRRVVGDETVDQILIPRDPNDPNDAPQIKTRFYSWERKPFLPVEFSVAAFRFGHSQVRGTYKINDVVPELPIFAQTEDPGPFEDFHGGRHLPPAWTVDWSFFFDTSGVGSSRQKSLAIDTKLAEGLFKLPGVPPHLESLAARNIRRSSKFSLPSGRRVAGAMLLEPLSREELGLRHPAPLWFYVLKEAELRTGGEHLGPVGGRIVAEVLLGLLAGDPLSYVNSAPGWEPTLPDADGDGKFTIVDLLHFAGVVTVQPQPEPWR